VYIVSETAQVELKSGRVLAPATRPLMGSSHPEWDSSPASGHDGSAAAAAGTAGTGAPGTGAAAGAPGCAALALEAAAACGVGEEHGRGATRSVSIATPTIPTARGCE
jgi:hypothetical protein